MALKDHYILIYLNFMKYILPHLDRVNLLFQSKSKTLHFLHGQITDLYKVLLEKICDPLIIAQRPLQEIDPSDPANHLPVNQIYLGPQLHQWFQTS